MYIDIYVDVVTDSTSSGSVNFVLLLIILMEQAAGGAVGWGIALQAGRSRVQFPMVSLEFSFTQTFRPHYGPGVDSASNRTEYQKYFLGGGGVKAAGA
jgi:hypothetical protein